MYTIPIKKDMVAAKGTFTVSEKTATKVCRVINRSKFKDAKKTIEDIINGKKSLNGKFHTSAATEILNLLKIVEANARARGFDPEDMEIYISAHRGPTLLRARRKRRFGFRMKQSNIQVVLKKVKKSDTGKKLR